MVTATIVNSCYGKWAAYDDNGCSFGETKKEAKARLKERRNVKEPMGVDMVEEMLDSAQEWREKLDFNSAFMMIMCVHGALSILKLYAACDAVDVLQERANGLQDLIIDEELEAKGVTR